jgi:hypothetical protein
MTSTAGFHADTSSLAGVVPVGLVGPGRSWIALLHGTPTDPWLDPSGGRLDVPAARSGSGVSLAPLGDVLELEQDEGRFDPPIDGATLDGRELLVSGSGFGASIEAPPGSRVYVQNELGARPVIHIVPPTGAVRVVVRAPDDAGPNPTYRPELLIVTPSGHAYRERWRVTVLEEPPPLDAEAETSLGSSSVMVAGGTAPDTEIHVRGERATVDGDGHFSVRVDLPPWPTDVEVVAIDRVGNEARLTVVGVGWFDYRDLPWTALAIVLVGVAGAILTLRAPRPPAGQRPAADDGALEELDIEG